MIKLINLLNKFIDNEDYESLETFIGEFLDLFSFSENEEENIILTSIFFKNLLILFLYFFNYPYFYGVLTDDEINKISSNFMPNIINL